MVNRESRKNQKRGEKKSEKNINPSLHKNDFSKSQQI